MPTHTKLPVLALVIALATGCATVSPRTKIAVGTAVAVVGAVMIASTPDSEDCAPDDLDCAAVHVAFWQTFAMQGLMTYGLLLGGLAEVGSGLMDLHREDNAKREGMAIAPQTPVSSAPAPAIVALDRSRPENRLAIQASVTAHAGHCDAARLTAQQLSEQDPRLYAELRATDRAVDDCLRASAR